MAEFKVGDRVRHAPSGMTGTVTHITKKDVEPNGQRPEDTIVGYVVLLDDGSETTLFWDLEGLADEDIAPGE
jgi:hypothetical protein